MKAAALETIDEDADFVTTLTTLHGSNARASKAFKKAKRRRRRDVAVPSASESIVAVRHSVGTVPHSSEVLRFAALWEKIGSHAKSSLTFHLGQLAKAVARRHNESKLDTLQIIECVLVSDARHDPLSMSVLFMFANPFMSMLRDASIGAILDMKALAEERMTEDNDAMSWSPISSLSDGMILD